MGNSILLGQYFGNTSGEILEPGQTPAINQFPPSSSNTGNEGGNNLASSYGPSYGSYSPADSSQTGSNVGETGSSTGSSFGSSSDSYDGSLGSDSLSDSQSQYESSSGNSDSNDPTETPEQNADSEDQESDTGKIPEDTWMSGSFRCGIQKIQPSTRIVGGSVAVPHSWPWIVQVMISQFGSFYMPFCGGTIVSPRHVISALHCFGKENAKYKIGVGKHGHMKFSEGSEEAIAKIRPHPFGNVDGDYPYYDMVLITLEREQQFGTNIQPACLPPLRDQNPEQGRMCWAYGWGQTRKTGGRGYLKQVQLAVTNPLPCRSNYGDAGSAEFAFCAGGVPGKDTCQGDSGGPFTCKENGRWILYGATSHGVSCAVGVAGAYASISYSMNWFCCFLDRLPECAGVPCDPTDFRHPVPWYQL